MSCLFFFLFPASTVAHLARGSALFSKRERERVYLLSALNYALTPLVNNPHLRRRFDMGQAKRLQSTEYLSNLNYPVEVSSSSSLSPDILSAICKRGVARATLAVDARHTAEEQRAMQFCIMAL